MRARAKRSSRSGLTLLEALISLTVFGIFLSSAGMVGIRTYEAHRQASTQAAISEKLRGSTFRVVKELTGAGRNFLVPDPSTEFGADDLIFQKVVGVAGGAPVWGPQQRLAWEYESGEVDDGVDNNGNGLIDEGVLVLTRDFGTADQQRVVVCRNVSEFLAGEVPDGDDDNGNDVTDERGFSVRRVDDVLEIRLTLWSLGPRGDLAVQTMETGLRLRN